MSAVHIYVCVLSALHLLYKKVEVNWQNVQQVCQSPHLALLPESLCPTFPPAAEPQNHTT